MGRVLDLVCVIYGEEYYTWCVLYMGESIRPGVCYIRGRVLDLVCVIYKGESVTPGVYYIYGREC